MSRHVRIAQDAVMLDDLGNVMVGRFVNAHEHKGDLSDVNNIIKIHQGEMQEDGIVYPARTIALGHQECDRLRTALNRWMVDPDKVTVDRATLTNLAELASKYMEAESEAIRDLASAVTDVLGGVLGGVQA